jgi:hypothetical protein
MEFQLQYDCSHDNDKIKKKRCGKKEKKKKKKKIQLKTENQKMSKTDPTNNRG